MMGKSPASFAGWRKLPLVTTTLYSDSTLRQDTESISAVYATSCDGGGTLNLPVGGDFAAVGTEEYVGNYYSYQGGLRFAGSSIPSGATLTALSLSLYKYNSGNGRITGGDFALKVRKYDWGAAWANADWRTRAQATALPLAGTLASADGGDSSLQGTQRVITLDPTIFTPSADFMLLISSAQVESGAAPGATLISQLYYCCNSAVSASYRPALTVTYQP